MDIKREHAFAHLGPAPYRYTGCRENLFTVPGCPEATKPGGSCDHCGTGILYEFHFTAANGRTFKVGSSCVNKAGDAGLKRVIADDVRAYQRALRVVRDAKKAAILAAIVAEQWPAVRHVFARYPHPNAYFSGQGKTKADYLEFCGHAAIVAALQGDAREILTEEAAV